MLTLVLTRNVSLWERLTWLSCCGSLFLMSLQAYSKHWNGFMVRTNESVQTRSITWYENSLIAGTLLLYHENRFTMRKTSWRNLCSNGRITRAVFRENVMAAWLCVLVYREGQGTYVGYFLFCLELMMTACSRTFTSLLWERHVCVTILFRYREGKDFGFLLLIIICTHVRMQINTLSYTHA